MKPEQRRGLIACAIMLSALGGLFWWGAHFHLFGHVIHLNGPTFGFLAWLAIGAFGVGYARGGARAGLKSMGAFILFLAAALAFGFATGRYR